MDLGSGIRDPGSGKNLFRIPDPGVKKAPDPGSRIRIPDPDPGSGSATLYFSKSRVFSNRTFQRKLNFRIMTNCFAINIVNILRTRNLLKTISAVKKDCLLCEFFSKCQHFCVDCLICCANFWANVHFFASGENVTLFRIFKKKFPGSWKIHLVWTPDLSDKLITLGLEPVNLLLPVHPLVNQLLHLLLQQIQLVPQLGLGLLAFLDQLTFLLLGGIHRFLQLDEAFLTVLLGGLCRKDGVK